MNFKVMSRRTALEYSQQVHKNKSIIISITNTDDLICPIELTSENNIQSVLYMKFDDIQQTNKDEFKYFFGKNNNGTMSKEDFEQTDYKVFSKKDAEIICDFVDRYKDKVDTIIVHCLAGRSRSAGCCAAIMLALEGNDSSIFNNFYYHPNITVYTQLVKEFAKRGYKGVYGKHYD